MAHQIKELRNTLDAIDKEKNQFNLAERDKAAQSAVRREESHSFVDVDDVIGRDEEKKAIMNCLLHDAVQKNRPSVIAIVGMGGSGKTTLAKLIHKDDEAKRHFDLVMWVCVSDEFELKKVVQKIIKATERKSSILGSGFENMEIEQLVTMLREKIQGKRYLLFLDDVWNEDKHKWDELKKLLRPDREGSAVMVTTRSNKVANIMGEEKTYTLESLVDDVCMSIFLKCFPNEGQVKQNQNLVRIGKEIVKKCKGVPLAVKTMANLLCSKTDQDEWIKIRDSEIWELEQNQAGILPALKLSYQQLPPVLRRCFAYCTIFEKDLRYNNELVTQFWMAHGLLQYQKGSETYEDVGLRNIKELGLRCFFQEFEDYALLTSFKMHDLVHDLGFLVAGDEFFTITPSTHEIPKNVRHLLFLLFPAEELSSMPQNILVKLQELGCCVRTICIRCADESSTLNSIIEMSFSRFKYLRALEFAHSQFEVLPSTIGDLKHLRYLNLAMNQKIKRLPVSIYELQGLETLILYGCEEFEELPKDARYLINLRLLWITTKQKRFHSISSLTSLQNLYIFHCTNLECLCEDIRGLVNLRCLRIMECDSLIYLPSGLQDLAALELLLVTDCPNLNWSTVEPESNEDVKASRLKVICLGQLAKLDDLPQWLFQRSVQIIAINDCPKLRGFPNDCFLKMTSLQLLEIVNCPEMKEKYNEKTGPDWHKIAHIPKVSVW